MENKLTFLVVIKTLILLPLFFGILALCCIAILLCTILPNGKNLATKVYELFALTGIKFIGLNIKVQGEEYVDTDQSMLLFLTIPQL